MEFVEVMKHKQRLCDNTIRCSKCPLSCVDNNNGRNCGCTEFCTTYPEEAEKKIMHWAEENPIKTNREVAEEILTEKFGDVFDVSQFSCSLLKEGCGAITCEECDIRNFWDQEYKGVSEDANGN